jgi:hypothetical protein
MSPAMPKWPAPCRCPILADDDADQTQPMVALLIDGLRYGTTAPTTNSSTGGDARKLRRGVALRRPALADAARREGLDVTGH